MSEGKKDGLAVTAIITIIVILLFGIIIGGFAGCGAAKDFSRHQKLKNAQNNVKVTAINIQRAHQQARITEAQNGIVKAKAYQKYLESVGIRRAQDEINKTLTPLYVQHEAIQAMEHGGASKIYIPSGSQGIPLVNNVGGK